MFKEILENLLSKSWNPANAQKLRELWQSCSDYHGNPKFGEVAKLRKLAKLIERYCDTKSSVPADVAVIVKQIETEGLPDTAENEFGLIKYLGFLVNPSKGVFAGSFYFKAEVTKKYPMGYALDSEGQRQFQTRKKKGWGFYQLFLNGNETIPHPFYKTEEAIDEVWKQMKKENEIIEGDPKKIRVA